LHRDQSEHGEATTGSETRRCNTAEEATASDHDAEEREQKPEDTQRRCTRRHSTPLRDADNTRAVGSIHESTDNPIEDLQEWPNRPGLPQVNYNYVRIGFGSEPLIQC
jgi:hypothetical protein